MGNKEGSVPAASEETRAETALFILPECCHLAGNQSTNVLVQAFARLIMLGIVSSENMDQEVFKNY